MNPIDILGVHPTGALPKNPDPRDYTFDMPEVGHAPVPFDWKKGYLVEKDTGIKVSRKDQMQAGSCGGESISAAAQSLGAFHLKENSEKSAKAYYSQVFVPGGGSSSRALGDVLHKQGLFKEELVPSYPANGGTVTEAFMDRPQDISQNARKDAAATKNLFAYIYITDTTIDNVAAAVRDHKGVFIGIYGYNNGTWLSSMPSTNVVGQPWAHFMVVIGAQMHKNKKTLVCLQSWGKDAPDATQIQYISEDHFNKGRIWDAIAFVYAPTPAMPKHTFDTNMTYGEQSENVKALQSVLANEGVFNLTPTGAYFDATAKAVLKFRSKHGISSVTDPLGHSVGPATRAIINTL